MPYIENPKTKGSGIVCAIPQKGTCPRGCADCFFQSGRSYLEPLEENTPNMPAPSFEAYDKVVRVNDGNDSNHQRAEVLRATAMYPRRFYNTSSPEDLIGYRAPVVLTVNPGEMTDQFPYDPGDVGALPIPKNLMFVRVRTNTWNLNLVDEAVRRWTGVGVTVVLTFMAYHEVDSPLPNTVPLGHTQDYEFRRRTLNSYWAVTTKAWRRVMARYQDNPLVYSCGSEGISTACKNCGNCLREYFATVERMR
jgi:hypothetical protein